MVDKRVCNWTEVKPGEVFVVHKQTERWSDLTYQRDGVPLTIERGYVATYPHKQQILIHPSSPDFKRHYDQTIAIGQKGKESAKELFSMERYRDDWLKLLSQVLGKEVTINGVED